jgi:ribonuclease J
MTLTIHRGTHEIGGSCIELISATTRIFLDFGLPLVDREGVPLRFNRNSKETYPDLVASMVAPSVPYFQEGKDNKPTSLFLTHCHLDHYGLMPWLPTNIPVYTSKGTRKLLEIANFANQTSFNPSNIIIIEPWKSIQVGDFQVTPYLSDHSAPDAFSYLIEAEGKRIFYSGDLRAHGRKHVLFENLINNPPPGIEYLILEGSTLGRDLNEYQSEEDIENQLIEKLSNDGLYIASFSSQNLDRFVSFFNACRATKRTLVVDPYTASILDALKELSINIPQYDWKDSFRVFNVPNAHTKKMALNKSLFKYKAAKISLKEIQADKSHLVIKENYMIRDILKHKGMLSGGKLIYSMWDGYLKEDKFWKPNGVPIIKIHCSGHAYKEDLVKLVDAINPKAVIPNHTFFPEKYSELFGTKALVLNDGEQLEC